MEILYWVGCAPAYDPRAREIARALVSVLQKAKVDFAILGNRERCSGDLARRTGDEALFQELAIHNISTLHEHKVKKILTTCPHCLHTIGREYKAFGGDFEVIHHSQYLAQLLEEGRLTLTKPLAQSVTYHDPCYLGRHNGVTEEPRQVLQAVAGGPVVEMKRSGEKGFCCGAGGSSIWGGNRQGEKINHIRAAEAAETGAEVIASGCPFCTIMLEEGLGLAGKQLPVKDIAELIDEHTA
ncbi:(Fe-S)-binding protein [Brevibacillus massiliensis]|jgi:Fe-S oxidoreductase|uniref:(Fe-S)-binding protein n=1 Tax=Brevibacillus massiliensis TaxID=1118054 RepID=UPI00031906C4|nr:(Fe-S)-binding protein [Brevibacillus massiliensis]